MLKKCVIGRSFLAAIYHRCQVLSSGLSYAVADNGCRRLAEEPKRLRNNKGHLYDIHSSLFHLTRGYFRYIVWDFSGSIAYSNHATINLKLGIRSFFEE